MWAWSGVMESVASALRRAGHHALRVSGELPGPFERGGLAVARRFPRVSAIGTDFGGLVILRNARLRSLRLEWNSSVVVTFGSTFWPPHVSATFEDMTVAQHPALAETAAWSRWRRRQRALYDAAERCFMTTEWAAASVRDDYGQPREKVVVVGEGPNIVCAPTVKDWSRPNILWVGSEWHRKGGDILLEAFAVASIEGATLHLVGDHPPVGLANVVGHGRVADPARLRAMYEEATLFVLPSRFDASPIACLEAASAGTPLIGTQTGGTYERVGEAGVLIEPNDSRALADAMRHLCQPSVAEHYRRSAIRHAGHFTWDAVARRMIEAFERPSER
jgi:glycosyltransferase involved in cell wall biosynthesis